MRAIGHLNGLSISDIRLVEGLFERRASRETFIDPPMAVAISDVSLAVGRRIGLLVDRRGVVSEVLVGTATNLAIPPHARRRTGPGRLGGFRLLHTRLDGQGLDTQDLNDLRLYSLDASVGVLAEVSGHLPRISVGWLLPANPDERLWDVLPPAFPAQIEVRFDETVRDIETRMRHDASMLRDGGTQGRVVRDVAIIVLPWAGRSRELGWTVAELHALCDTAGIVVADTVVQRRNQPDPRTVIGRGKLASVTMAALQKGVDLIICGVSLTPSQQRAMAQETGVRVIDRNQLILDIFAKHAHTSDGRLQVELAQLRYNLPRLSEKDDSLSRLTGGIGTLGPGETKLEMERRRARERIHQLEGRIDVLSQQRARRRARRQESAVPLVALVGYTNAGKSTIFNTMTAAGVQAQDRLFATLDPTTRRAYVEGHGPILLTDTVGFIRSLPPDLVGAFRATLEEIGLAKVLILVADVSDPNVHEQIAAVRQILSDLELDQIPQVLALNKTDRVSDSDAVALLAASLGGVPVCGLNASTLGPLWLAVQQKMGTSE